jgi:hypothetical protein
MRHLFSSRKLKKESERVTRAQVMQRALERGSRTAVTSTANRRPMTWSVDKNSAPVMLPHVQLEAKVLGIQYPGHWPGLYASAPMSRPAGPIHLPTSFGGYRLSLIGIHQSPLTPVLESSSTQATCRAILVETSCSAECGLTITVSESRCYRLWPVSPLHDLQLQFCGHCCTYTLYGA